MTNACAYCGQPLQVVAGFCASCGAPIEIASQAKLVARALRDAQAPPALLPAASVAVPLAALTPRPAPGATRILLCGGIVALALVVVAVSLRLGVNPIRALVPPAGGTLGISLTTGGDDVSVITMGTPFALHYAVTVETESALVTLTIAPDGLPARSLSERWPRGTTQRSQDLSAVAAGVWHITLQRDGVTLQTMDLTITNATMTNSSGS